MSCVYVVGNDVNPLVKIGFTKTTARRRLFSLQTGSPVRLHLLWEHEGDRRDEVRLHQRFSRYRAHGEWFDLGPNAVERIAQEFETTGLAHGWPLPLPQPAPPETPAAKPRLLWHISTDGGRGIPMEARPYKERKRRKDYLARRHAEALAENAARDAEKASSRP